MKRKVMQSMEVALASLLTMGLHAAGVWSTSSCAPADWTTLDNNLLSGQIGTISGTIATGYSTNDPKLLTDDTVPTTGGKEWIVGFQNSASIAWTFPAPKTLNSVRVSCGYLAGATYSGFTVSKVEVKTMESDDWVSVSSGEGRMSATPNADILSQVLTDDGSAALAESVVALKVTFGAPPVGFVNYCVEIEAAGFAEATGPILGAVDVTPAKTKALIAGTLSDVGTDASSCDIFLSLAGADAVKIAEGVTDAFEYVIAGLSPETTYAYELTVSNNAEPAKSSVKSGSFTTVAADAETAAWTISDYLPGTWAPVKGNLLLNLTPSDSTLVSPYANKEVATLSDGRVPSASVNATVVGFQPNGTIAWTFDDAKTIESLRVSSLWEGRTYNGLSVKTIEVRYPGDETTWVTLNLPAVEWAGGTQDGQCAVLADAETGCLAEGVIGLRLTFGKQKAAVANYYAEIEAVGYATAGEATAPEIAEPTVELPTATKAVVSGSLATIGQKALYASLSFAWGTDPEALGASELLSDNAIAGTPYSVTLSDLTPETTYYYAFTAQNDAVETVVVKTGSFTTPALAWIDCVLEITGGHVSVVAGETTYTASSTISVLRGEELTLKAMPDSGYVFERWTGDVAAADVSKNPLTLVMSEACRVSPVVRPIGDGVTVTWKGGDGAWEDATRWDAGFVPTVADTVVIASGTCTAAERVSVGNLTLSGEAKLVVAEPNGGRYGDLFVTGNLLLSDSSELQVAAGPLDGDRHTFATGSGFVTVGRTFGIKDTAKFVPCCDQYTGGGVVTKAGTFSLAAGATVDAVAKGFAWFADREPNSQALGSPIGDKGANGWYGASYGGQGDTYGGGTGIRGNGGVAPYGFANAPVHPGSHKFNNAQKNNDPRAGGGNVRIHAENVRLAGKIDVTTTPVVTSGAPSGGGIWITAAKRLAVAPTTQLLAQGGDSPKFGNGNGGGGRIAFGLRLKDEDLAALAETGLLPERSTVAVGGEAEFLVDYPSVTVSLDGGKANNDASDQPLEVCRGTFRYLAGKPFGLVVVLR